MKKRVLSLLLCLVMAVGLLPVTAMAAEEKVTYIDRIDLELSEEDLAKFYHTGLDEWDSVQLSYYRGVGHKENKLYEVWANGVRRIRNNWWFLASPRSDGRLSKSCSYMLAFNVLLNKADGYQTCLAEKGLRRVTLNGKDVSFVARDFEGSRFNLFVQIDPPKDPQGENAVRVKDFALGGKTYPASNASIPVEAGVEQTLSIRLALPEWYARRKNDDMADAIGFLPNLQIFESENIGKNVGTIKGSPVYEYNKTDKTGVMTYQMTFTPKEGTEYYLLGLFDYKLKEDGDKLPSVGCGAVLKCPAKNTISGTVYYTNACYYGKALTTDVDAYNNSGKITSGLHYQWQRFDRGWADISGATADRYAPRGEDVGMRIRVKVTADGCEGAIYGGDKIVGKAPLAAPDCPVMTAVKDASGSYTGFTVQSPTGWIEYAYSADPNQSPDDMPKTTDTTVTGLSAGRTYYVYARKKDTGVEKTSPWSRMGSVLLSDPSYLSRVTLTDSGETLAPYGKGNTIYLKKGETKTLNISTNPTGANQWQYFTFKSLASDAAFTVKSPTGSVAPGNMPASVTLCGERVGLGTLGAYYGPAGDSYGTWSVVVYDESRIPSFEITETPAFEDTTLVPGERYQPKSVPMTVTTKPAGALDGCTFQWAVVTGTGGAYGSANEYLSVNASTGEVTALKKTDGANLLYQRVVLQAVKDGNVRSVTDYVVTVTDAAEGGHSHNYTYTALNDALHQARCANKDGECGQLLKVEDHNFGGWTTLKAATKETAGERQHTCKDCGRTVKEPIPALVESVEAKGENPFTDVADSSPYKDAILWAAEQGITTGTSATTFSPNAPCTRGQAVTFLWRAAGSPAPKSGTMPFTDVAATSVYAKAILWAVENGITLGTSATTFSPNAKCTRGQIVTFLHRSQKTPAVSGSNAFTDVAADSPFLKAILWAKETGVTTGTTATTFAPNAVCTRGQIVTFLYRCLAE